MTKTSIISNHLDLMALLSAPNIRVKSIVDTLGGKIIANYQELDEIDTSFNTNCMVAAVTTCHARLCLYQLLDILKERTLYFDTGW